MSAPSPSSFTFWLDARLDHLFRVQAYRQPLAKAAILSAYAEAESGGEVQVFERALRRATDPKVARLIRRHEADENRHAAMFEARREALGLPRFPIPARLRTIERLSEAAGGILDRSMDSDADIVAVYQLLFVIEERAMAEFGRARRAALATGDRETAAMLDEIAADERRHLAYCRAVGREFAGSEAAFEAGLEPLRALEAKVYSEQSTAFMDWMLDLGALRLAGPLGALLTLVLGLGRRVRGTAPSATMVLAAA